MPKLRLLFLVPLALLLVSSAPIVQAGSAPPPSGPSVTLSTTPTDAFGDGTDCTAALSNSVFTATSNTAISAPVMLDAGNPAAMSGTTRSDQFGDGDVCQITEAGAGMTFDFPAGALSFQVLVGIADVTGLNTIEVTSTLTSGGPGPMQSVDFISDGTEIVTLQAPANNTLASVTITWTVAASSAFFDDVAATVNTVPAANGVVCSITQPIVLGDTNVPPTLANPTEDSSGDTQFELRLVCQPDTVNNVDVFGIDFTTSITDDLTSAEPDDLLTLIPPATAASDAFDLANGTGDFFENPVLGATGATNSLAELYATLQNPSTGLTDGFGIGTLQFDVLQPIEDGRFETDPEPTFTVAFSNIQFSNEAGTPITPVDFNGVVNVSVEDVLDADLDLAFPIFSDGVLPAPGGFQDLRYSLFRDPAEPTIDDVIISETDGPVRNEGVTFQSFFGAPDVVDLTDADSPLTATVDAYGHVRCWAGDSYALRDRREVGNSRNRLGFGGGQSVTLIAGDTNNDEIIDSTDADLITDPAVFNSAPSGNPDEETDINSDGVVNVLDLAHVGRNFGEDFSIQPNNGFNDLPLCGTGNVALIMSN